MRIFQHRARVPRCHWLINELQCIAPLGHPGSEHPTSRRDPGSRGEGRFNNTIREPDPDGYALGFTLGRRSMRDEITGSYMCPWGGDNSPPLGTLCPWYGEVTAEHPWPMWEFCDGRTVTKFSGEGKVMPDLTGFLGVPMWAQAINGQTSA